MIQTFVDQFMSAKPALEAGLRAEEPENYEDLVKRVIEVLRGDGYSTPDPYRIHTINDGDYQGTLLFIIGATGYQPSTYWSVAVDYGSCSGCDTFEAIRDLRPWDEDEVTDAQVKDYMTLMLHIVQGLKQIT